ncbi:MAG TPA: matrixin family metalloprotease [Gemmatimonadales bacterium]|jgi:hypothetical protein
MRRSLLGTLTLALFVLILADRISQHVPRRETRVQVVQGTNDSRAATAAVHPAAGITHGADLPVRSATPTVDRLARLATRQQLTREAATTYLDSLMLSTDSVVRRWPDRYGSPLKVALVEGGVNGYAPRMAEYMRDALNRWENTAIGLRFETVPDTTGADVVVHWIDHFDIDRAGQTDLTWDQAGRVRRATISLALRTNTGAALGDAALLAVAVHEVGHALGLPHSGDTTDVMFPATRTGNLSERDRRTIAVLYRLPPGPVRDLLADAP